MMYLPRFSFTRRRAVFVALALGVMAAAWLRLLLPRTRKLFGSGKDAVYAPWIGEPSTDDLKNAIRHLEAIPQDSDVFMRGAEVLPPPVYVRATKLLPLLRLKRDRPQDYLALEEATYRSCIAKAYASPAPSICTVGLPESCAPLASSERLAQLRTLVLFR